MDNLEKGVQCYELFGALINHTFSFFFIFIDSFLNCIRYCFYDVSRVAGIFVNV